MNEIITSIITLLRASLSGTYKKFYYWEVRVPNQAFLPFIEVVPVWTRIQNKWTGGLMTNEFQVRVNIKNSLKKYLQQNTNVETLDHVQDLVEKMEWRTNSNLDNDTILWILHNNLQLSWNANIIGDWEITYDEIDLGESYITYASVLFTVKIITV